MKPREKRLETILEKTIRIVEQEGIMNLSMRKVAKECNLTLSNLQYYYSGKSELLLASVEYFFTECENQIMAERDSLLQKHGIPSKEFLKKILELLIIREKKDTSIFFLEFWVLAIREEVFANTLHEYYARYAKKMIELISDLYPFAKEITSLLIPFSEGYCLVGKSLPMDRDEIIELFCSLFWNCKLQQD